MRGSLVSQMTESNTDIRLSLWQATIALALVVALLLALFWHFLVVQVNYSAQYLGDWGHTFIIPLVTGYLIWCERDRLLARPLASAPAGMGLILLGLAFYCLTLFGPGFLQVHNAKSIGIMITIFGVAVTLCGWASLRVLWFPILYLAAFGQFISPQILAPITERMQDIAASGAFFMFELLGFETTRLGNLITLESDGVARPLDVAEACSGMKMLMAFMAMGVFIAWTGLPTLWQRVVLVALGLPIAIVVNILRITTQGILDSMDSALSVGEAHSMLSLLWLIPAMLLYLFFLWVLEPFAPEDESPEPAPVEAIPVTGGVPRTYLVMVGLLALCTIGVHLVANPTGMRSIKGAAPLRASLDSLPQVVGEWVHFGDDLVYNDTIVDVLGTDLYIDRTYALGGDPRAGLLQVHVAFYTGGVSNRPHVPERCWAVHGMTASRDSELVPLDELTGFWATGDAVNQATGTNYPVHPWRHPVTEIESTIHLPVGDHVLRTTLFADGSDSMRRMVGGYFFIANGRLTPSALSVRRLAYNFESTHAYFCKVQFNMQDFGSSLDDDQLLELFANRVEGMLKDLLPEVMRILPDWPEYENPDPTSS